MDGEPGFHPGHRPVHVRSAIYVTGAWAELRNAPDDALENCLAVDHPNPWTSRAYREERWDGKIRLFRGSRFPAGLTLRVVEYLRELGRDVFVHGYEEAREHDWSRIGADYLPRVGKFKKLWPHQLDAVHAALSARCGIIKAPTGSGKTEVIAALARALFEEFDWNSLILVPKKGLMHQTVERLQLYYQDDVKVGWMGDSERVDGDVIVATAQTMQGWLPRKVGKRRRAADPRLRAIVKGFQVIIGDECLDPSTAVSVPSGTKALGSLQVGDEVCTPTGEVARVTRTWRTRKHANRYVFTGGRELIASADHPVLSGTYARGGIVPIAEAKRMLLDCSVPSRPLGYSADEWLLGFFLGDGCCYWRGDSGRFGVKWSFRKDVEAIAAAFSRHGASVLRRENSRGDTTFELPAAEARQFQRRWSIRPGRKARTVVIPDELVRSASIGVVKGLFDAEASRTCDRIAFDMASSRCVEQVAQILAVHGIRATPHRAAKRADPKHARLHRLVLCGDTINRYNTLVGFSIPRKQRNQLGRDWRRRHAQVSRISTESLGIRELVDIELDHPDHLFVANGLIVHNCHRASSDSWYDIFMHSGAHRRYGFSATPLKDSELSDFKMIGATGPVIYECDASVLIAAGLAAKPKIAMVMSEAASGRDVTEQVRDAARARTVELRQARGLRVRNEHAVKPDPKELYRCAYREGLIANPHHNRAVILAVQWLVDHGRRPLVMCRYKAHFEDLRERLEATGISFIAVWGASDKGDRDLAKHSYGSGTTRVVLATTIWDEGEDIPGVDAIVLAEGVKSVTNALQRIGRGMRRDTKDVWVVDFVPTSHATLTSHAAARAASYEQEGYEVVLVETWPRRSEHAPEDLLPFLDWKRALKNA